MSGVFDAYAAYYDLLYRDKDYVGEVAWLHDLIQRHAPDAHALLELGCGTGAHAAHFSRLGYSVHGIDVSEEMLCRANALAASLPEAQAARLQFEHGDVRDWRGAGQFDVVLSLFHVFSYQVSDADIRAAFSTAAAHLRKGGVLIIDFWYGPAVVAQQPESRVRQLEDEHIRLLRIAEPKSFPDENRVDVNYEVRIEDRRNGGQSRFFETHRMRYFFEPELDALARGCGLEPVLFREWLSDREPSADSWSAMLLARCSA
jgi:SAM-dependent methyltransferase